MAALTEQALTGAADLSVPLEVLDGLGQLVGRGQRRLSSPTRPPVRRPASCPAGVGGRAHPVVYRIPTRSPLPAGEATVHESELATTCPDSHVYRGTALLSDEAMGTFDENGNYVPRAVDRGRPRPAIPRGRHGRHHRRVRRRRPRRGHRGQDRPRRGPARHRLQVRGRHPGPRALDPQRRRPRGDRHPGRPRRGPGPPEGGQGGPPRPLEEAGPVRAGLGAPSRS